MGKHKFEGMVIGAYHVCPPIPDRSMDWCAVLDDYDGADDSGHQPMGWGVTEEEAIADLLTQIEEHE